MKSETIQNRKTRIEGFGFVCRVTASRGKRTHGQQRGCFFIYISRYTKKPHFLCPCVLFDLEVVGFPERPGPVSFETRPGEGFFLENRKC